MADRTIRNTSPGSAALSLNALHKFAPSQTPPNPLDASPGTPFQCPPAPTARTVGLSTFGAACSEPPPYPTGTPFPPALPCLIQTKSNREEDAWSTRLLLSSQSHPGSNSSCCPPIDIPTLLRNLAQSLPNKTDIFYCKTGQPAPKGQLQAAQRGCASQKEDFSQLNPAKGLLLPGG